MELDNKESVQIIKEVEQKINVIIENLEKNKFIALEIKQVVDNVN